MEFEERLERYKLLIDSAMALYLSAYPTDATMLREAMLYAATGGKRLRGAILLAVCEELGVEVLDALGLAVAIEMVHAYSLVHDDLPCMDDDDTRRGKPSCHRKYGEAMALLCGDALLTAAFEVAVPSQIPSLSQSDVGRVETGSNRRDLSSGSVLRALSTLARAAGAAGMVAGQVLDLGLDGDLTVAESVSHMYKLKTGRLFEAAAQMGAIASGASEEVIEAAGSWGLSFGYAFQIADDLDDMAVPEAEVAGEVQGPEGAETACGGKTTLASVTSWEKAREEAASSLRASLAALAVFPTGRQRFLEALSSRYLTLLSAQDA